MCNPPSPSCPMCKAVGYGFIEGIVNTPFRLLNGIKRTFSVDNMSINNPEQSFEERRRRTGKEIRVIKKILIENPDSVESVYTGLDPVTREQVDESVAGFTGNMAGTMFGKFLMGNLAAFYLPKHIRVPPRLFIPMNIPITAVLSMLMFQGMVAEFERRRTNVFTAFPEIEKSYDDILDRINNDQRD